MKKGKSVRHMIFSILCVMLMILCANTQTKAETTREEADIFADMTLVVETDNPLTYFARAHGRLYASDRINTLGQANIRIDYNPILPWYDPDWWGGISHMGDFGIGTDGQTLGPLSLRWEFSRAYTSQNDPLHPLDMNVKIYVRLAYIEHPDGVLPPPQGPKMLELIIHRDPTTWHITGYTALSSTLDFQDVGRFAKQNTLPKVSGVAPSPAVTYHTIKESTIDGILPSTNIYFLEDNVMWHRNLGMPEVTLGHSGTPLQFEDSEFFEVPSEGYYALYQAGGGPLLFSNGTIGAIGIFNQHQTVMDSDGDATHFTRVLIVKTRTAPTVVLRYADGDLESEVFSDGTLNGGVEGWSNRSLIASLASEVQYGPYYTKIIDDEGREFYGETHRSPAELRFDNNTVGTDVTGVLVDDAKTIELSETATPVTLKIDKDSPIAGASADNGMLINESRDELSGMQATKVAIVKTGETPPDASVYEDFGDWQTFVVGEGQYDVYIIAIDKAGNKGTTTLTNQFLRGTTTDLEISKTVSGEYGSYHKAFEITITLKDTEEAPVNAAYSVTSNLADVTDYTITFTNGEGKVYVKHNETITIKGLLVGHTYTVRETDVTITDASSLYDVAYNGVVSEHGVTARLESSLAQVFIENVRDVIPETGIEENGGKIIMGGTLVLLASLIVLMFYCDRKKKTEQ